VAPGAAAAPRAVQVLSLLLVALLLLRLARNELRNGAGIRFLLWLQYAASALAAILFGGYAMSLQRWMYLCGLVALVPACVSGLFTFAGGRLPR